MSQKTARKTRTAQRKAPPPVKSAGRGGGIPRKWLYAGAGGIALVIVLVLVVASLAGGGDDPENTPLAVAGDETESLLAGVPQEGLRLGPDDASLKLVEFADLKCPFCQRFQLDVLPTVVDQYVRPGDVQLEISGMAFLGEGSETALRAVLAASLQDKAWNVADLLYTQQGPENENWVTDELLRAVGNAVPGLGVDKMMSDMDSAEVDELYQQAAQQRADLGVTRTPTFFVVSGDGPPTKLEFESLTPEAFTTAIDAQLGR
jgi:protein-disulfide isomerase